MKIGDEVFVHGFVDEIRVDQVIINNRGGYFGTLPDEITPPYITRHGEWKDIDGDGYYWECSACGEVLCCNNNFCPNCGAKMDRGGDAE